MKFRTEIEPLPCGGTIDLDSRIVMIGSCFTDNIGGMLRKHNFDVTVNPFGTLFNPLSMSGAINEALDRRAFTTGDVIAANGRFVTLRRHSAWSDTDPCRLVDRLNRSSAEARRAMENADTLIATFGSAIAFRDNLSGEIAANCHKLHPSRFTREEISVDAVTEAWSEVIGRLRLINRSMKVILTVSPVRHAGYGLAVDRLSKSRLLLAADSLARRHDGVIYFPAYEIMIDDLRDYRFYADDMLHPSATAVEYIFDIFARSFIDDVTMTVARRWEKLYRRAAHRHLAGEAVAEAFAAETDLMARKLDTEFSKKYTGLYDRFKNHVSSCQQA